MKKLSIALGLFVVSLSTCQASDSFGVVSTDGSSACLATSRNITAFPLRVRVVIPGTPGKSVVGVITSSLKKPCKALAKADLGGNYYSLRVTRELEAWNLGIALFNAQSSVQVRACTSREGVHLSAWEGMPLVGKRLWHEYIYLGYDVEATCSEPDYDD